MVGFVREQRKKLSHKGNIWSMYVVPEARGEGIGKRLLVEVVRRCHYLDSLEQINLTVTGIKQNNKILSRIAKNGNVIMYRPEFTETSYTFKGQPKGRKTATTFSGFCGFHDKIVFQPIEDNDYDGSLKQNFLYAYRAFAFEYHKKHEAYNALCLSLQSKPSLIKENWFVQDLRGHEAGLKDLSYYKEKFDEAIIKSKYDLVETVSLKYNGLSHLAVCSSFFLEFDISGNKLNDVRTLDPTRLKLMMFNIFPQSTATIVLFSWLREDNKFYTNFKKQLMFFAST